MTHKPVKCGCVFKIKDTDFTISITHCDVYSDDCHACVYLSRGPKNVAMINVHKPSFIERLFQITWEEKIKSAKEYFITDAMRILDEEKQFADAVREVAE